MTIEPVSAKIIAQLAIKTITDEESRNKIIIAVTIPIIIVLIALSMFVYILSSPLSFITGFFTGENAKFTVEQMIVVGSLLIRTSDISKKCDVSENIGILVSMIPSLARRYFKIKSGDRPVLNSTTKAGEYSVSLLAGRNNEVFSVICLDSQNRVNYTDILNEGTINEAPVYPRLIVETALRHQANSVILAHNHPGGTLQPSNADIEITKKIVAAMDPISIKVMDHIIVAGDKYYSFAEKGLLGR